MVIKGCFYDLLSDGRLPSWVTQLSSSVESPSLSLNSPQQSGASLHFKWKQSDCQEDFLFLKWIHYWDPSSDCTISQSSSPIVHRVFQQLIEEGKLLPLSLIGLIGVEQKNIPSWDNWSALALQSLTEKTGNQYWKTWHWLSKPSRLMGTHTQVL